jgi:pyruvate kinase
MQINFNKTKIIATVGPASNSYEMLFALVTEGVDVFRLNFSHGTHDDHLKVIRTVRQIKRRARHQYLFNAGPAGPEDPLR